MKFIHHHRRNIFEVKRLGIQQPIEQNFGDDHQHGSVGVGSPIAGYQTDLVCRKSPADGRLAKLDQFLVRQCDQRRRVVHSFAGPQRLVHRGLGDQRFPRPCGGTHQHSLLVRKIRQ